MRISIAASQVVEICYRTEDDERFATDRKIFPEKAREGKRGFPGKT